ncbi:YvcK family protein [Mechercharimyces sp. CAU 1602]|uniref:gluconeogenesis factor YvcK family protein n=1 Tax=Mechercharimyces sp. CAU 1602 TaxID=2973933 RepID=UPI00216124E9|nr:YvcK family protein [Mechercharimyces sp. CAU 1602]MCS1352200.1 YvcK family protein [Mechercharimyces sp. CAU 1602]
MGGERQPHVVVIGGGTGLGVLLRGMKHHPLELTAIVTVADDGGSSGRLRTDLQMPPPGDIRNVLLALADAEPLLKSIFEYRFQNGDGLRGHAVGNLILAAMKDITGDFTQAIKELSRVLAVRGRVLPASEQDVVLVAEMTDGTIVRGESQIPKSGKKIRKVYLEPPNPRPLEEAIQAIEDADLIVIGPGSLYTSVIPNLLVKGMAEAIRSSRAEKVYIGNVMTQPGETCGYTAHDHLAVIEQHMGGRIIDTVLLNSEIPEVSILKPYAEEGSEPVFPDCERLIESGYHVIADNFIQYQDQVIRHNAQRLSQHLLRIVRA